jgi:hypothetical protein
MADTETPIRDLMYKIAKRAGELANKKMPELRSINGYGCNTNWEAQQKDQYKNRGQVIEEILAEEFEHDAANLDGTAIY